MFWRAACGCWAIRIRPLPVAEQCLTEAADLGDPPTIVYALAWNMLIYLRVGDWPMTDQIIARLMNHVAKTGMSTYYSVALGCQGGLAILRGEPSRGTELLQTALAAMHRDGYEFYRGVFSGALAEGFAALGQAELAHSTICDAVNWAEGHGASADLPELLRIKGETLILLSPGDTQQAEMCLAGSLRLAQQQSALSLELRSAMSLARLWTDGGQVEKALAPAQPGPRPVFGRAGHARSWSPPASSWTSCAGGAEPAPAPPPWQCGCGGVPDWLEGVPVFYRPRRRTADCYSFNWRFP